MAFYLLGGHGFLVPMEGLLQSWIIQVRMNNFAYGDGN